MELKNIPPIGQRIIKSSCAVALCMIIYYIRSMLPIGNGIPFYSALAALWCMQPYDKTTKDNAGQRSFGTITGAVFGLAFLNILHFMSITNQIVVYLLASAMIIPVIYFTVLTQKRNASFFSCVVFLSIALTHSFDDDPYIFVFNRVLDTFIGIVVGIGINDLHIPIKHDKETLYVSGVDDVLISSDDHSIPFSKVELNRLIEDGVKFSVSTIRNPCELVSIMDGVELNLPVVVMDGAALYDTKEKKYLKILDIPFDICSRAEHIIAQCGMNCFVEALYDTTFLTYYDELKNKAEIDLFESHCRSTHIHYIRMSYRHNDEKVLCITVVDKESNILILKDKLESELGDHLRITVTRSKYEGFLFLKVYSIMASKHKMLIQLQKYAGTDKIITFGSIEGEYDVYIKDGGGNATIKKLKRIYRSGSVH